MIAPIYIVDSFTDVAFKGNPAGVCLLSEPTDEKTMLAIAQELNLSETAFIVRTEDQFNIRYFSPIKEIPLCGHATLAAAKVLFENHPLNRIQFVTHYNVTLIISRKEDKISMEFPKYDSIQCKVPMNLLSSLGINELKESRFNKENNMLMLVIEEEELMNLQPDFNKLKQSHDAIDGVLVTAKSDTEYDFKSRYFWPWSGGNEDPVTGATHTFMAPYWADILKKRKLKSFQASKRTGFMEVEVEDDKIVIMGEAVIVVKGTLTV